MKKLLLATAATALVAGTASADEVKLGILLGFTGPLESTVAIMTKGAEMAIKEVSDSGKFLDGTTVGFVKGDDTCTDATVATAAAERLITSDKVAAIIGGDCSGVTTAVLQNVAKPNGILMVSPSATSPALSTVDDGGLFFRTAPSDARQGYVVAQILKDRGVKSIALSYSNTDYGKGLAEAIDAEFKATGGTVTISAPHEDGKADYSAEVAALAAAGGEVLVVAGYVDQGGKGIIQASIDSGAFSVFYLPDGMYGQSLVDAIGAALNGSYGDVPGVEGEGIEKFKKMSADAGFDGTSAFVGESYDAAALILLAMQAGGAPTSAAAKDKIMELANAPGEKIYPGELGKALDLIKEGKDIDYVGATNVELVGSGESAGNYREYDITDGKIVTKQFR
ncbi:MAG: ABC transporter substrate-binding protein [Paracoccaceae bacterium]